MAQRGSPRAAHTRHRDETRLGGTSIEVLETGPSGIPALVRSPPQQDQPLRPRELCIRCPRVPRNFPRFCPGLRKVLLGLMLTPWPGHQGKSHSFPSSAVDLMRSAARTMLAATHAAPRRLCTARSHTPDNTMTQCFTNNKIIWDAPWPISALTRGNVLMGRGQQEDSSAAPAPH